MRAWLGRPRTWFDWLLLWLVVGYFAVVAAWDLGPSVRSSVDAVEDGRVWVLGTSSLEATGELRALQVVLLALVTCVLIAREGAALWWLVALAGHVGSALVAYALIGVAMLLGSESADRVADQTDYGISCVLAAALGALAVSGAQALRRGGRRDVDFAALASGVLGLLGLLPFSFGWYDVEHPIAWALGALVAWLVIRRRPARQGPAPVGRSDPAAQ